MCNLWTYKSDERNNLVFDEISKYVFICTVFESYNQWCNRMGVEFPSDISHREISADLPGKERLEKKRKNGREKKENRKREFGILKMESAQGFQKWREDPFFVCLFGFCLFVCLFVLFCFVFVLFLFCFPLFKTTEICFGSTKMGKKNRKMTSPPLKNIPFTPLVIILLFSEVWKKKRNGIKSVVSAKIMYKSLYAIRS